MNPEHREDQLELFDPSAQATPPPRRLSGPFQMVLRHDQLLLSGIGTIIGLTVIFAVGVERGKELVRSERAFLMRQQQAPAQRPQADAAPEPAGRTDTAQAAPSVKTEEPAERKVPAATTQPSALKEPSKLAAGKRRYAIQVVSYSRPQLAKQEMDRLRSQGERAFLVMRDGRTSVFIGPFPTKGNASERLTALKPRYQDCFVRSL